MNQEGTERTMPTPSRTTSPARQAALAAVMRATPGTERYRQARAEFDAIAAQEDARPVPGRI